MTSHSNTFGPRFILTGTGTIIVHFWKDIEHSKDPELTYKIGC